MALCQHCQKEDPTGGTPTLLGLWCPKCLRGYDEATWKMGGYYATPGTGPAGKVCKDCRHFRRIEYHDKRYRKCGMVEETRGPGTDIKASSPACAGFQEPEVERERTLDRGASPVEAPGNPEKPG